MTDDESIIEVNEEDVRITESDDVVQITVEEVQATISETVMGMRGAPGEGDKHYQHDQDVPADEWIIEHNLGKRPAVTVVDSGGTEWQVEVQHVSDDVCRIYFDNAFTGKAYLN